MRRAIDGAVNSGTKLLAYGCCDGKVTKHNKWLPRHHFFIARQTKCNQVEVNGV